MAITLLSTSGNIPLSGIQPVYHVVVIGKSLPLFSAVLLDKLTPQNNTGLGTSTSLGDAWHTTPTEVSILDVVNRYLVNPLTAVEMKYILAHPEKFTFEMGAGDRREAFKSRIVEVDNWHGEDVTGLVLTPNPANAPAYKFSLTFSAVTGMMKLTDGHAGQPNTYGALRYLTVRAK
ncbi:TPA: hypothetical protein G8O67_005498 [Salmonella enterica]|uniref:Uncharacterized protein n=1 Tax=Salmonella enterica TaxID=28901 RepID=A0A756I7G0_SALER|nr:hypothetical protein [Salmonella enterica]